MPALCSGLQNKKSFSLLLGRLPTRPSFRARALPLKGGNEVEGSLTSCPVGESQCEFSGPGWRADLYSTLGVRRILGDLRQKMPLGVFSATCSWRDIAGNAAKCAVLGCWTGYFSDIKDLLAEGSEFEL
jgi:hypothetical protein